MFRSYERLRAALAHLDSNCRSQEIHEHTAKAA
jgi:hypothetical protein